MYRISMMARNSHSMGRELELGEIYFSYGQLCVYDARPGQDLALDIKPDHIAQGFACSDSSAYLFHPLIQQGVADVTLRIGQIPEVDTLRREGFTRALAVPFEVRSGKLMVEGGPGEEGKDFALRFGVYKLVLAEKQIEEERLAVTIFLEPCSASQDATVPSPTSTFLIWEGQRPAAARFTADKLSLD